MTDTIFAAVVGWGSIAILTVIATLLFTAVIADGIQEMKIDRIRRQVLEEMDKSITGRAKQ